MVRVLIVTLVALVLLVAAAVVFLPIHYEVMPHVQDTSKELPAPQLHKVEPVMPTFNQESFDARWKDAPDEIRAVASLIAKGGQPDKAALDALGREKLSQGYPAPALDFERNGEPVAYLATLLQEALLGYNLGATKALLAAGADADVNNGEVLFIAVTQQTRGAPAFLLFPDFDETLPFLQAYLEAGANPNPLHYGFMPNTPFSDARIYSNLGAMLILLQFKADPWLRPIGPNNSDWDSALENAAFSSGNLAAAEVLFRLARSGNLHRGSPKQVAYVFAQFDSIIDQFASGTGPDSRHTAWRIDQVLQHLGQALDEPEKAKALRSRLSRFDYQADGGWYLAEDEVHSRYDAPLNVPDKGDQIWGP